MKDVIRDRHGWPIEVQGWAAVYFYESSYNAPGSPRCVMPGAFAAPDLRQVMFNKDHDPGRQLFGKLQLAEFASFGFAFRLSMIEPTDLAVETIGAIRNGDLNYCSFKGAMTPAIIRDGAGKEVSVILHVVSLDDICVTEHPACEGTSCWTSDAPSLSPRLRMYRDTWMSSVLDGVRWTTVDLVQSENSQLGSAA